MEVKLINDDCISAMKEMDDDSVDSVVTDPPYGYKFMGKKWDYDVPGIDVWKECLRVLKPGGHLLSFAGTRTQHRMCVNIEDAGFEIRDMIAWVYGSGFPKSHNISKAIDKKAGVERVVVGKREHPTLKDVSKIEEQANAAHGSNEWARVWDLTAPATEEANQWEGWGTALKPALEPITVARKPFNTTIADNVLKYGTGGLNIDGCRITTVENITNHSRSKESAISKGKYGDSQEQETHQTDSQKLGRFPANLIHDGSNEVTELFPSNAGAFAPVRRGHDGKSNGIYGDYYQKGDDGASFRGDIGSAARFFYCAKASKEDRDEGLEGIEKRQQDESRKQGNPGGDNPRNRGLQLRYNNHPTVKPTDLMRYLCRLVTPPKGIILDPYMGSGSTGKGAVKEGFSFIGIDDDKQWIEVAQKRINMARNQLSLF
ncbi:MAG: DNA methyltransferase [Bacteroidota bacterium]